MNKHIIRLLRPHQWLKNAFVLTPLFFDRRTTDLHYATPCLLAFAAFCLAASGIYCFNDIRDADADRLHPTKRWRPVASGAVSTRMAYATMTAAWVLAFMLVAVGSLHSDCSLLGLAGTLLFYIAMNVAYCMKLKHVPLLDVFIIAMGFVLRIVAGGLATGIVLSHWLVVTTFLLALFLALAKRRDDMALYESSGIKARKNVEKYNLTFLDHAIGMLGGATIVCYILYTVSPDVVERLGSPHLYVTSLFVVAGILHYMRITFVDKKSSSPTRVLLRDLFIQACVAGWITAFAIILYYK